MTTFVLIHGAGTGGWLWDAEVAQLRRRGHTVLAPTLRGVGDRVADGGPETDLSTHINEVVNLIAPPTVVAPVLVGFSYGGLVVGGVVERVADKSAGLIYLDAFVPVNGRSLFDFMPPELRTFLERSAEASGAGWQMPPIPLERLGGLGNLGAGVELDQVRAELTRRGPHPIATYREAARVSNPRAQRVPRAYITCTDHPESDPMIVVVDAVRAAGVPVYELATGHFPMLTMPVELADTLERVTAACAMDGH